MKGNDCPSLTSDSHFLGPGVLPLRVALSFFVLKLKFGNLTLKTSQVWSDLVKESGQSQSQLVFR